MSTVNLSWIITTRNKLAFLKEVLHRLLSDLHEDEEIIVVDGASTDGTVEYLTELHRQGLIHHFLSEPDHGEAEGFNKGMLLANGRLIKILTDDDAFYLPEDEGRMLVSYGGKQHQVQGMWLDPDAAKRRVKTLPVRRDKDFEYQRDEDQEEGLLPR